jgi:hypothetical protein
MRGWKSQSRLLVALLLATLCALVCSTAQAVPPGTFGRMFGDQPAARFADTDLRDLAQTMLEQQALGQPDNNSSFVVGQFVDHDMTLDTSPSPDAPINIRSLDNDRNGNLDLDSVYGAGPTETPALYEADKKHLKVGISNGIPDVPRNADGSAILGDGRNDENLVIVQLHAAFLRFHNRLVDQGMSFAQARLTTVRQWQWLILNEYLPRFVGNVARIPNRYKPGNKNDPVLPVEFTAACFRFGHSQIRNAYQLNDDAAARVVFAPGTLTDLLADNPRTLLGGRFIPADGGIDWGEFFDIPGADPDPDPNRGRRIDTHLSPPLFGLPIGSVVAGGGSNVLGFRNMTRASAYGVPSYEDVARALGITPINVRAEVPTLPAAFTTKTPLWFGMLAESESLGGQKLGPTCGRIINEVIRTNIERSPDFSDNFVPLARSMGEFLVLAGVAGDSD